MAQFKGFPSLRLLASLGPAGQALANDLREFETSWRNLSVEVAKLNPAEPASSASSWGPSATSAVPYSRTLTAGSGLTGGGDLSADRTFNVGAGTGITVAADTVSIASGYLGANPTASVGLSAVNGSATTYLRSDGAPALSQAITPTWTNVHTFSSEAVFNGGIDLGTNGRFDSNVANAVSAYNFLFKPTTTLTSGNDRYLFSIQDSSGEGRFNVNAAGCISLYNDDVLSSAAVLSISGTIGNTINYGMLFNPNWGATAGASNILGLTNAVTGAYYGGSDTTSTTSDWCIALAVTNTGFRRAHSGGFVGLVVRPVSSWTGSGNNAHGSCYGVWVKQSIATGAGVGQTWTALTGVHIDNMQSGANPVPADCYGLRVNEQTRGTNKYGVWIDTATAAYKALVIGSTNAYLYYPATDTLGLAGTQIRVVGDLFHTGSQAGFYNIGPVARPAAYTQTYSTADRTIAARTTSALAYSEGTPGTTLAAIPDPADTPADADTLRDDIVTNVLPKIRDAISSLVAELNKNRDDDLDTTQGLNVVIDDFQANGLLQ